MDWILHLDFIILLKVVILDLILGIDNAVVIALATAGLAVEHRNKAIALGTAGAILARIGFLFIAFWLVGLPAVKLIAGAYLVYLAYSLAKGDDEECNVKSKTTLFGAISTIVIADIAMSLDNVIALTASAGDHQQAFGYTVFGVLLSIPIILLASKFLLKLLDKFPIIIYLGGALIAFVGVEMILHEQLLQKYLTWMTPAFALLIKTLVAVIAVGVAYKQNKQAQLV